jgi:hypothetical protein
MQTNFRGIDKTIVLTVFRIYSSIGAPRKGAQKGMKERRTSTDIENRSDFGSAGDGSAVESAF